MIILVFFLMTVSPGIIEFLTSMLNRLRVSIEEKRAGRQAEKEKIRLR